MKFAAAIFALASLAPSASADESMLSGAAFRLGSSCHKDEKCKEEYYKSLWYRCCRPGVDAGTTDKGAWRRKDVPTVDGKPGSEEKYLKPRCDDGCCCPVRGLDKAGWFSKETYYAKWQDACTDGGSIFNKAFPSGFPEPSIGTEQDDLEIDI